MEAQLVRNIEKLTGTMRAIQENGRRAREQRADHDCLAPMADAISAVTGRSVEMLRRELAGERSSGSAGLPNAAPGIEQGESTPSSWGRSVAAASRLG